MHVTLIEPTIPLSSAQYAHPVLFILSLGPASGIVGEFVALPLFIEPSVLDVEVPIAQTVSPFNTYRNISVPLSSFLKIGLPLLQSPFSNLLGIDLDYINILVTMILECVSHA